MFFDGRACSIAAYRPYAHALCILIRISLLLLSNTTQMGFSHSHSVCSSIWATPLTMVTVVIYRYGLRSMSIRERWEPQTTKENWLWILSISKMVYILAYGCCFVGAITTTNNTHLNASNGTRMRMGRYIHGKNMCIPLFMKRHFSPYKNACFLNTHAVLVPVERIAFES